MAGVRRTWDKKYYEERARERLEQGGVIDEEKTNDSKKKIPAAKEEFQPASRDAVGPMGSERAFLHARQERIDVDSKVGKTEIIDPTSADKAHGAGYWCEVCACLLKDSASYLDHINGKKHQRALGFSMRVERADVSKVQDRIAGLKREIEAKKNKPTVSAMDSYEARIAAQIAEQELRKKQRREQKEAKKIEEVVEEDDGDAEMAALMGFSGFTKKK